MPGSTFGGQALPLANLDTVNYLNRYHSFGQVLKANLSTSLPQNARNYGMVERSFPLGNDFDTLYWPSGATRFSYAHHLVSDRILNIIRGITASSSNWLPKTYTIADDQYTISTPMYMLPAQPISQNTGPLMETGGTGTISSSGTTVTGLGTFFLSEIVDGAVIGNPTNGYFTVVSVSSNTSLTISTTPIVPFNNSSFTFAGSANYSAFNNLWLVTFVDYRYLWWFQSNTYDSFDPGTTTWTDLYTYIFETILGYESDEYFIDSISSAFGTPSSRFQFTYQDPIPVVLDTIASSLGQRIFVDYTTGVVNVQNYPTSKTTYFNNLTGFSGQRCAGGNYYTYQNVSSTTSSTDLIQTYPRYSTVLFPGQNSSGNTVDWIGYTVTGQYNTGYGGNYLADVTGGGVNLGFYGNRVLYADLDATLNATGGVTNLSSVSAYAVSLAQSENNWYLYGSDYTIGGIKPWVPEGITDRVEFHLESNYDVNGNGSYALATTRVFRSSFLAAESRSLALTSVGGGQNVSGVDVEDDKGNRINDTTLIQIDNSTLSGDDTHSVFVPDRADYGVYGIINIQDQFLGYGTKYAAPGFIAGGPLSPGVGFLLANKTLEISNTGISGSGLVIQQGGLGHLANAGYSDSSYSGLQIYDGIYGTNNQILLEPVATGPVVPTAAVALSIQAASGYSFIAINPNTTFAGTIAQISGYAMLPGDVFIGNNVWMCYNPNGPGFPTYIKGYTGVDAAGTSFIGGVANAVHPIGNPIFAVLPSSINLPIGVWTNILAITLPASTSNVTCKLSANVWASMSVQFVTPGQTVFISARLVDFNGVLINGSLTEVVDTNIIQHISTTSPIDVPYTYFATTVPITVTLQATINSSGGGFEVFEAKVESSPNPGTLSSSAEGVTRLLATAL